MLEVLALLLVLNVIQVAGLKAFLGDNNLVHIPPVITSRWTDCPSLPI